MTARRRLFITHAGELAHRLVRAVRPQGLVARFVQSYARQHGREGVVDDPARLRELESTMGREAVLVMVAHVQQSLPRALGAAKRHPLGAGEATFAQIFWQEFLTSLGRALEWPAAEFAAEREAFDKDLLLYGRWAERPASPGPDTVPHTAISPFCDRCALLLDPSMMEEARRAAAQFEGEVIGAATRILGQLGRATVRPTRGRRRRRPRSRSRQSPRRARRPQRRSRRSGRRPQR